jgi:hypothetical protein
MKAKTSPHLKGTNVRWRNGDCEGFKNRGWFLEVMQPMAKWLTYTGL